jgi:hypothetical protein
LNEHPHDDELYQLMQNKGYIDKLKFYRDRTIFIDNIEKNLTLEEVKKINDLMVIKAGEKIEEKKLDLQYEDNDKFKEEVNKIYRDALRQAKDEMFGDSWSETEKEKE